MPFLKYKMTFTYIGAWSCPQKLGGTDAPISACMHIRLCVCVLKRVGFARSGWRGPSGEGLLSKACLAQGWHEGVQPREPLVH